LGVGHTIVSDSRRTDWATVDRIAQLALYRNVALLPLTAPPSSPASSPIPSTLPNSSMSALDLSKTSDILFLNDIYVCPSDALELLFQRKVQKADAACGMDWRENKKGWFSGKSVKFYDNWVRLPPSLLLPFEAQAADAMLCWQVSRSITGRLLRHKLDVFSERRDGVKELFDQKGDEFSKERFRRGLAVPVCASSFLFFCPSFLC
jgi:hypothetical protein